MHLTANCTWKIDLEFCHIGAEGVEMLVRGAVEEETHCTGGISEIKLSGNDITSEGVKYLLSIQKNLINKLKTLDSGVQQVRFRILCNPIPFHSKTCLI